MMDEEMEDTKESEEVSDEKNHPLSREGWIMLLSGEINKEEMKMTSYWNACIVILIAFLCAEVAFLVAIFQSGVWLLHYILVLTMFIFLALTVIYYKCYLYPSLQERLKPLIKAREATIFSKSTDFSEIRRIWKEYVEKWLLEKSEMDEEEKESKRKKDNSKEKASEKNVKERKEVLQVPQRDIGDIKERLQEIKDMMEETNLSNLFYVFGSLFVAVGLTIIFVTIMPLQKYYSLQLIAGYITFFIGVSIIVAGCIWTAAKMQLKRKIIINRKT